MRRQSSSEAGAARQVHEAESFISILILTHNAPEYVELTLRSVARHTHALAHEVVVVDNASDASTVSLLQELKDDGLIDTLELSPTNTFFARGNNRAAALASGRATHFLLLNSDIVVLSDEWLSTLLGAHHRGITTYGIVNHPPVRVDGYCLLIDADLYRGTPMDEKFEWWWAVAKQQAMLMRQGYWVGGFYAHEQYLHHFGGRSGKAFRGARGMQTSLRDVRGWFAGNTPVVIDGLPKLSGLPAVRRKLSDAKMMVSDMIERFRG